MRPFSLLVKPASADCNLDCEYCFYKDKGGLYPDRPRHRMSDETLKAMMRNVFSAPQREFGFGWQGGEPTLMGLDFFKQVVELQKAHAPEGSVVSNGLQTNGTLIDDEFATWLADNEFLVGISIDGPEAVHDRYRTTFGGGGSHHQVLQGLDALTRHGVEFNVLGLVTQANVERPAELYHYLKSLGSAYHQYIPCVEYDDSGELMPYAVSAEQWGRFLAGLFDEWAAGDAESVSIRFFDSLLQKLLTGDTTMCSMGKDCRHYFVVEHNGDIFPCDFFVEPHLRLGNVSDDRFVDLWRSRPYRAFGRMKRHWNEACDDCEFLSYCAGDCLKMRFRDGEDPGALSALCPGWKHFYEHTMPRFEELAGDFRSGRLRRR